MSNIIARFASAADARRFAIAKCLPLPTAGRHPRSGATVWNIASPRLEPLPSWDDSAYLIDPEFERIGY